MGTEGKMVNNWGLYGWPFFLSHNLQLFETWSYSRLNYGFNLKKEDVANSNFKLNLKMWGT